MSHYIHSLAMANPRGALPQPAEIETRLEDAEGG